jgi:hypothetical protein
MAVRRYRYLQLNEPHFVAEYTPRVNNPQSLPRPEGHDHANLHRALLIGRAAGGRPDRRPVAPAGGGRPDRLGSTEVL